MAITTTLTSVSSKLKEGWAEWVKSGYTLLGMLRTFALGHTHTGGVDGTLIPITGLTSASITSAYLTSACKTHVSTNKWLVSSTGGNAELPVFYAPVACVVTSAYAVTSANVIGNATDYNTLYLKKYTAGVLGGTLCTANSGTSGTWLAHSAKSLGAITGGTLAAGDVLTLAKATVAGGTAIADSSVAILWYPTAV